MLRLKIVAFFPVRCDSASGYCNVTSPVCKYAQTKRDFNTIHSVRGNKLQNTTKKTR